MESALGWVDDLFHLFGREPPPNLNLYIALVTILVPLPIVFLFVHSARPRQGIVPPYRERVLILGASSGVGEELALQYSQRGCRNLVLVARRADELAKVKAKCDERRKEGEEWEQSQEAPGWEKVGETVTTIAADCTKPEDLLKIRQLVRKSE
jgi:NADPH:quinone reductase-like Zn-dependent oxidoreductase